jgi:hypothetical protein
MPPSSRPFPRFIADTPQEKRPYGRWGARLAEAFAGACDGLAAEAGVPLDPETVRWFPERAWGGRVYVPATARAADAAGDGGEAPGPVEYFGWLSFTRSEGGEPEDLIARAEFTDVVADDNPEWRIDLNDDVIGRWRADGGRGGDVTLVWGMPLIPKAVAATAELDGETLDQTAVDEGRFTLVAVDAVEGFGDPLYLEVKLWDRRLNELAAESLYDEGEEAGEGEQASAAGTS